MYMSPAFNDEDRDSIRATIRAARLANLVTGTAEGPQVSPLPLLLDADEGEHGTLYGHLARANPWEVSDAPADYMAAQLPGIVGLRIPITRLEGKKKMSQNRSEADRRGVALVLAASQRAEDRAAAELITTRDQT